MATQQVVMELHLEKKTRKLVDELKSAGLNCGLLVMQGTVVMRCAGVPFKDSPTVYDEADLKIAVELNLLEKKKMRADALTGSFEREYYVVREKAVK